MQTFLQIFESGTSLAVCIMWCSLVMSESESNLTLDELIYNKKEKCKFLSSVGDLKSCNQF